MNKDNIVYLNMITPSKVDINTNKLYDTFLLAISLYIDGVTYYYERNDVDLTIIPTTNKPDSFRRMMFLEQAQQEINFKNDANSIIYIRNSYEYICKDIYHLLKDKMIKDEPIWILGKYTNEDQMTFLKMMDSVYDLKNTFQFKFIEFDSLIFLFEEMEKVTGDDYKITETAKKELNSDYFNMISKSKPCLIENNFVMKVMNLLIFKK